MKILSINTSEPQKVIFNGKELITSIYKKPVSKKVQVTPQGIEGDRQADLSVHGGFDKAVYGYSYTHYKLWGERLEKDFKEFGLVGENLTIDEFDENTINIGDRFQINDCILQVSQPRIPCYKIGIKMNSRDFPKMFSQSGLLGSYFRVIQQGSIETGDQIEKVHSEENSMSLKEIASVLFVDIKNIDLMKKALDIKPLTEEIKEKFRERLMKLGDFSSL
jgi:MOSC domain-containing protein YiiM